jgi:tRNA(fMet)-specific endonuclease VapC
MGLIFDSSVLICLERNLQKVEKIIAGKEEEPYGISVITVSELLHGVHRADSEKRRLEREAFVERVIELFPAYPFDLNAARIYARIWSNLAKKGTAIGAHDLMIGATCISLGYVVLTSDVRDFERIPGLKIEKFPPRSDP